MNPSEESIHQYKKQKITIPDDFVAFFLIYVEDVFNYFNLFYIVVFYSVLMRFRFWFMLIVSPLNYVILFLMLPYSSWYFFFCGVILAYCTFQDHCNNISQAICLSTMWLPVFHQESKSNSPTLNTEKLVTALTSSVCGNWRHVSLRLAQKRHIGSIQGS